MRTIVTRAAAILVLGLLAALPARAHHALAALVDTSKMVDVTGVVDRIEWVNPHIYFYINVTDDQGKVTRWALESLPPAMMSRAGIKRDAVQIGQKITATGFNSLEKPLQWPIKLTFEDGHVLQLMDPNTVKGGRP
jgi:Family of unknown function (DUF6152)